MQEELILQLMSAFDRSTISKLSLEIGDVRLKMEKYSGEAVVMPAMPQGIQQQAAPVETAATSAVSGVEVKAPIVGVFYPASGPDAEPFVQLGQPVKKGQTLCILEAMKVMNEIPSPADGVVAAINVQREALVEFDQVLMVIAPAGSSNV